jgi:hypothetical protein
MGDLVAAFGYTVLNSVASGTIIDVVGKVKFGTADEDKGLGTGEDDYSVQIDGYKAFKRLTFLLTAGIRDRGSRFSWLCHGSSRGAGNSSGSHESSSQGRKKELATTTRQLGVSASDQGAIGKPTRIR